MPKSTDAKPAKPARGDKPAAAKAARAAKPAGEAVAAAAVAAPAKARPKPEAKGAAKAASLPTGLKLRDLIDSVATATGAKKPDAKIAVEATLAALAEALKSGSDMTLPPLGKLRVVKLAEKGGATMMTLKLRHGGGAGKAGSKPLAKDGEDD
jgi:nucleoid DNA-binding protein